MAGASFDFHEVYALAGDLQAAAGVVQQQIRQIVGTVAARIVADAQAAAPVDTGYHKSSIYAEPTGEGMAVGARSNYAGYLEFGTSRMAPRPHIMPAIDRNLPLLEAAIQQISPL